MNQKFNYAKKEEIAGELKENVILPVSALTVIFAEIVFSSRNPVGVACEVDSAFPENFGNDRLVIVSTLFP